MEMTLEEVMLAMMPLSLVHESRAKDCHLLLKISMFFFSKILFENIYVTLFNQYDGICYNFRLYIFS